MHCRPTFDTRTTRQCVWRCMDLGQTLGQSVCQECNVEETEGLDSSQVVLTVVYEACRTALNQATNYLKDSESRCM